MAEGKLELLGHSGGITKRQVGMGDVIPHNAKMRSAKAGREKKEGRQRSLGSTLGMNRRRIIV